MLIRTTHFGVLAKKSAEGVMDINNEREWNAKILVIVRWSHTKDIIRTDWSHTLFWRLVDIYNKTLFCLFVIAFNFSPY